MTARQLSFGSAEHTRKRKRTRHVAPGDGASGGVGLRRRQAELQHRSVAVRSTRRATARPDNRSGNLPIGFGAGGGRREPKEFLDLDSKTSINRLTFERLGMLDENGLSLTGNQLVEACFRSDELGPLSVGFRLWANGLVHTVCNEIGSRRCDLFVRL